MEFDKSRVFSFLNANELKIGSKVLCADSLSELKELVQNYETSNSSVVRIYIGNRGESTIFPIITAEDIFFALAYLLEEPMEEPKEPYYRPYESIDELLAAWQRLTGIMAKEFSMPLIWVKSKTTGEMLMIQGFDRGSSMVMVANLWCDIESLYNSFTFLDGSPCGVEVCDENTDKGQCR